MTISDAFTVSESFTLPIMTAEELLEQLNHLTCECIPY